MLLLQMIDTLAQLSMMLMMGIYFIFSNTVMRTLRQSESGAEIMIAINREILNPNFYGVFFGSAIASLALVLARTGDSLAGGIFFVGAFLVTLLRNVPLNNSLMAAISDSSLENEWQQYLSKWVFWNHVRTLSACTSCALLLW